MKLATTSLALLLLALCSGMAAAGPSNVNDEAEVHLAARAKGDFCQLRVADPTGPEVVFKKHHCKNGCTNGGCVPNIGQYGACWQCNAKGDNCRPNEACTS